jgi:hypothetical protein
VYWAQIEAAKRRLVYSCLALGLPLKSKREDEAGGLAFAFLANRPPAAGSTKPADRVMTGHDKGLITLNIEEADEIEREQIRRQMKEAYRTLLGHFRHESGHYYWDRLVPGTRFEEPFRERFGDERQDYGEALRRFYTSGGPADWQNQFISVYAATHPWEDWAETWAHYLHMIDTLETARAFGMSEDKAGGPGIDEQHLRVREGDGGSLPSAGIAKLLKEWVWVSLALNELNRGMGVRDFYPFVMNEIVVRKLQFVHDVIGGSSTRGS